MTFSPSPELLLSLSPAVLARLLSTFGGPDAKPGVPPIEIARAVFAGASPARLRRALLFLARFATPPGAPRSID